MVRSHGRIPLIFLVGVILLGSSVLAQNSSFRVRQMTRNDVPRGVGQCDIRLRVDDEVVAALRGDMLEVRNIRGNGWRDEGCECNMPLPSREVQNFQFRGIDGRGSVDLIEAPSRRNGFRAVVRILDTKGGSEGYHYRLSWDAKSGSGGWDNNSRDDWGHDHGRDQSFHDELQIIDASYGVPGRYRTVTERVIKQMRNGHVSMIVTNNKMGGDPAPGQDKELVVHYRYRNSRIESVRVREGDFLNLPEPGNNKRH